MPKFRSIVLIAFLISTVSISLARAPDMSLDEVAKESDVVLIGRTVRIVESLEEGGIPRGTATIYIEKIIKGTTLGREIEIIYEPCVQSIYPTYYLCERNILFLGRAETKMTFRAYFGNLDRSGKYVTIGGYLGKISIRNVDNTAMDILLLGEETNQPLDKFLQKIDRLISK
jgi:hypothetical protein